MGPGAPNATAQKITGKDQIHVLNYDKESVL